MTGLNVTQVVEDGEHAVTVTAADLDDPLTRLSYALRYAGLLKAFEDLSVAQSNAYKAMCRSDLQADQGVRGALTLTLTVDDALEAIEALTVAAGEPAKCESCQRTLVGSDASLCGPCDDHWSSSERLRGA